MSAAAARARPPIPATGWLRILFRVTAMIGLLILCLPLHLLWAPFTEHNPWPRRFLKAIARVMGVRITVSGKPPGPGAMLLSNHVSWLDIPVLAGATGTAFVAHDGLARATWLRWIASLHDTVFIARDRRATVARQIDQVREAIRETGALTIFPEGTTADGVELLPFKSALLSALTPIPAGITVYPVWLDYGMAASAIAWAGIEPGLSNFLKVAARREHLPVKIHFLEPIAGSALSDRKTITAAAREAIERAKRMSEYVRDQRRAL